MNGEAPGSASATPPSAPPPGSSSQPRTFYAKSRILSLLMGIFTAKHCCNCFGWVKNEEVIPFWTPDDDTANQNGVRDGYDNETFESDSISTATQRTYTQTATHTSQKPPARVVKGRTQGKKFGSPGRRGSESESEDSFSMTYSETASDASDVECRIKTLTEELQRRKLEAEKLKKEQKKKAKEKLKEKEARLKREIEEYESYINDAKNDIEGGDESPKGTVPPKIKQPAESRLFNKQDLKLADMRPRTDSDQSKSSNEEGANVPDSPSTPPTALVNGSSPVASPKESPKKPLSPSPVKADRRSLESITEKRESSPSASIHDNEEKTSTPKQRSRSLDEEKSVISEDFPEESLRTETGALDSDSAVLKLDLKSPENKKEEKESPLAAHSEKHYTETFTDAPDTARSTTEIPEEDSIQTARSEHSESVKLKLDKSEPLKLALDKVEEDSKNERYSKSENNVHSARSETAKSIYSDFTEDFESDVSHKSDRSYSYSSTSRSSRSDTYSDEYTHSASRRDKSPEKKSAVEDVDDKASVHTEDDFSELDDKIISPRLDLSKEDYKEPDRFANLNIGDRVLVGGAQPGTLRFKGRTEFAPGYWAGVELDAAHGRNDGAKDGVEYFRCLPLHGIFAPPEKIEPLPKDYEAVTPGEVADDSASEHTLTEHDDIQDEKLSDIEVEAAPVKGAEKDIKDDESVNEEASVGTVDSELERVISSAAAAVEEFGVQSDAETVASEASFELGKQEKFAEHVADSSLHDEVRDSVEVVSQSVEQAEKPKSPTKKDSLLEMLTADDLEEEEEDKSETTQKVDKTTSKLLTDAISQMLDIYTRKRSSSSESSESPPPTSPVAERPKSPDTPFPRKEEKSRMSSLVDLPPVPSLTFHETLDLATEQDDLEKLYGDIEDLDADGWMDDYDFGFGNKAPPPYPSKTAETAPSLMEKLQVDFQKVVHEPFSAVPQKKKEVEALTTDAVDHFWQMRRYGESWESAEPPEEYYGSDCKGQDKEASSRKAYKRLIFDLTGDILREVYKDEEETEPQPWAKPKRIKKKYHRGEDLPTTVDALQPLVNRQVMRILGHEKDPQAVKLTKWTSRKRRDHVDSVLLQELAEEEPDWVDYNEDELTVKMQIADSIFDTLLAETAQVVLGAAAAH